MMNGNPYISDPRDVELEHEVSQHLHNLGVERYHVSSHDGHVTISGFVDDFGDKREISERIRTIAGVKQLTNNLRVESNYYQGYDSRGNI